MKKSKTLKDYFTGEEEGTHITTSGTILPYIKKIIKLEKKTGPKHLKFSNDWKIFFWRDPNSGWERNVGFEKVNWQLAFQHNLGDKNFDIISIFSEDANIKVYVSHYIYFHRQICLDICMVNALTMIPELLRKNAVFMSRVICKFGKPALEHQLCGFKNEEIVVKMIEKKDIDYDIINKETDMQIVFFLTSDHHVLFKDSNNPYAKLEKMALKSLRWDIKYAFRDLNFLFV